MEGVVLQNELDAPPALFEDWLRERGIGFRIARAWEGDIPADPGRVRLGRVAGRR